MDWNILKEKPLNLELKDTVLLKSGLIAKVNGFTRNSIPKIYVLEIVEGNHKGEIVKVEIDEIDKLIKLI